MPVIPTAIRALRSARAHFASEGGFGMIVALGALAVTSLLLTATYVALQGDAHLSQHDLDGKRAFSAARASLNVYVNQLNQDPNLFWQTCANDSNSITAVPGATTGEQYSYAPVLANGSTSCTTDAIKSLIDTATGTLRMEFVGYSGTPSVSRAIIATFRKSSPLDYLWFTVYEALDSSINGYTGCNVFYRAGTRPNACNISFVTGDTLNGPMYTQDQYLISGSPTLGRTTADKIMSAAPGTGNSVICAGSNCGSALIRGQAWPNAPTISPPPDNSALLTDAQKYGKTYTGVTTITLNGDQSATVMNCRTTCTTPTTVNLVTSPIIYVQNSCTPPAYSPFGTTYASPPSGCGGDVYVQSAASANYTTPVTIAAANDIIITGPITTTENGSGQPTGAATLGLIANRFVRIQHGVTSRGTTHGDCKAPVGGATASNVSGQYDSNLKIDAAIMGIQHSFIVDNYDCGASLGNLTINGAVAQYFRGTVGRSGASGYIKKYSYDDRLKVTVPPFLFDIATSGWHVTRETLCVLGGSIAATAC